MTIPSLRSLAVSAAVLCLLAVPAWAARVVEVRVGLHPTFTRVVFELDAPAGYRIERGEPAGASEMVVTLDAGSERRALSSRGPLVAAVELDAGEDESTARVRLRRAAPRVKEMILGSPPRIVLDFVLPDDLVAAAAAGKPAVKPADAPKPLAAATPAEPAKAVDARPAPARPLEPFVVARPDAPEAERPETARPGRALGAKAGEPAPPTAAPRPLPPTTPLAEPTTPLAEPTTPPVEPKPEAPEAPPPAEEPAATRVESALEGERIVEPEPPLPEGAEAEEVESDASASAPAVPPPAIPEPVAKAPVAAPPKPLTKAPAAPPPSSPLSRVVGFGWSGSNPWLTLGIVGGAALLLLIVIALLLRRSRSTSLDALEMARERTGAIGAVDAFETPVGAGAQEGAMPRRGEAPAMAPGIFDEEFEKGEGEMGMEAAFPIERERARGAGAGVDSAVAPAVRELELRVAQLESRLEQMNEARERLERQVGAQSEELRVQRAAIARTQRALRGMTRSGEEQATEPALRDPGKPTPGRM